MAKPEPSNCAFRWFWGQTHLIGPLKPSKCATRWLSHLIPPNHMVQRVLMEVESDRGSVSLDEKSIYSDCGPMLTLNTNNNMTVAFTQANRYDEPVPVGDPTYSVFLKPSNLQQGDMPMGSKCFFHCKCAAVTGEEGRSLARETRPITLAGLQSSSGKVGRGATAATACGQYGQRYTLGTTLEFLNVKTEYVARVARDEAANYCG